jgi:hypothetical protein
VSVLALFFDAVCQSAQRECRIAREAIVQARAPTELFSPRVDLHDGLVLGQVVTIRKICTDEQHEFSVVQGCRAPAKTDESGQADVAGIVVLNDLLRTQRVTNGGLHPPRESDHFVVRLSHARPAVQSDLLVGVNQLCNVVKPGLRRCHSRLVEGETVGRQTLVSGAELRGVAQQGHDRHTQPQRHSRGRSLGSTSLRLPRFR